jgi:hypothetical protein
MGWAPATPLEAGMEQTFRWIYDELVRNPSRSAAAS